MDQIQTMVMVAAGSLVVIAAAMLVVCLKFTSIAGRILEKLDEPAAAAAVPPFVQPAAPAACAAPQAPLLSGVDEETAAMLMAITADTMGAAPEELRFVSIKEIR